MAWSLALALAAGPLVRHARAQATAEVSAEDKETARVVFGLAVGLRDQGKLREALEKFQLANKLYSTPITALELGKTHLALNELVAAHAAFTSVASIPVRPSESEKSAEARTEAAKLALEVRPRLAELTVEIVGLSKGATASLTIDGAPVPHDRIQAAQLLDPGKHVVVLRVDGAKDQQADVTLVEAEKRAVTLVVPQPETPYVPPPRPIEPRGTSPLVYVGFGVAGAGVLVGSITGLVALGKASDVKKQCVDVSCPPETAGDLDTSRRMGNVSTVAFVVAGVGATIGVIGLFVSKGGDEESAGAASVHAFVGPGSLGIGGAF